MALLIPLRGQRGGSAAARLMVVRQRTTRHMKSNHSSRRWLGPASLCRQTKDPVVRCSLSGLARGFCRGFGSILV